MNRGFTLLRSRQFSAAAEAFTRAIEMDPDNAEAYNHRGVARAYMGKIDDAISDYTRALQIKPELVGALNNRGSAFYQKKLLNRAISDYSKAIEINPYLAEAYSNRGTAWAAKGDYFRAIHILMPRTTIVGVPYRPSATMIRPSAIFSGSLNSTQNSMMRIICWQQYLPSVRTQNTEMAPKPLCWQKKRLI